MSYEVYTAEYIGQPTHVAIYIETQPSANEQTRSGLMFHVVGNILQGMTYESRATRDPLLSATYVAHTKKIGTIAIGDLARFEQRCCHAVAQKRKDPSKPLYRCNHWLDDVIRLAFQNGILKP